MTTLLEEGAGDRMRAFALIVLSFVLIGCASGQIERPNAEAIAQADLRARKLEVVAALASLTAERKAWEAGTDDKPSAATVEDGERAFDLRVEAFEARERALLEPLARRGNAEALYRLSLRLRDDDAPEEVRRWHGLVTASAALGHPLAQLELVRWHWHQKGDGSVAQVQRNRAKALDYAAQAAAGGEMFGLTRIAVYIAGNVHQYPADLTLARGLLTLCSQTGDDGCQERLAMPGTYDYGLSPAQSQMWLSRLAARHPERFATASALAWAKLSPEDQAVASRLAKAAGPASWPQLHQQWADLRRDILLKGETSVGAEVPCTTMAPWCRGKFVDP